MNKMSMQTLRARSARIIKIAVVAAAVSIAAPVTYGTVTAQQLQEGQIVKVKMAFSYKGLTVCGFKCWSIAKRCCLIIINPH